MLSVRNTILGFYKVSSSTAIQIANLRNYRKNGGYDYNFYSVTCSPDTTKCYAVSKNRDNDGIYRYLITKYTINLESSSVTLDDNTARDVEGCTSTDIAVSNNHYAQICSGKVYIYDHGSNDGALIKEITVGAQNIEFSPDGYKLMVSMSEDSGFNQYIRVYNAVDCTFVSG